MADTKGLIDIVLPVCPGWHNHRQLRRWVASLPSRAWIDNDVAHLIVAEDPDPCKWYILKQDMLRPTERWARVGGSIMEGFWAAYEQGLQDIRPQNCRCEIKISTSDY